MRIAEIYVSKQGEGALTGTPSVFVRASGCNLRCWFCDTPFTSWQPTGDDHSVPEITERVLAHGERHVVLTGGEPLLFAELVPLTVALRVAGRHLTIETAGTLYQPVACDLMSISPKLANSTPSADLAGRWHARHEQERWVPTVVARFLREYACQLKYVVDQPEDLAEIDAQLAELAALVPEGVRGDQLWLMPQGTNPVELAERAAWLQPLCAQRGWNYCPRMHIEWYGHTRGT
ncbi:MAG: 7-carboxy-7-deazaguanine synthase QueE [Pirellulales bacterium]|nr:7-carboxy-7-deazaguanine synthase QueE [Pirellulales bacterium]